MKTKNIYFIHTGCTIASQIDPDGSLSPSGDPSVFFNIGRYLPDADFIEKTPYTILSENLRPFHWGLLAECINEALSNDSNDVTAIIMTHGTDTLSWTAAWLAYVFGGCNVPIFIVAANKPFDHPDSNGTANMQAAFRAISEGIKPGVYVPYKNPEDETVTMHRGERITASPDFSDSFYSAENIGLSRGKEPFCYCQPGSDAAYHRMENPGCFSGQNCRISYPHILMIRPYPGIGYDAFDISRAAAVLHGSYHSYTAASDSECGLLDFAGRIADAGKKLYFAPISSGQDRMYASTQALLDTGLIEPLYDMTFESAYAYLLLKYNGR